MRYHFRKCSNTNRRLLALTTLLLAAGAQQVCAKETSFYTLSGHWQSGSKNRGLSELNQAAPKGLTFLQVRLVRENPSKDYRLRVTDLGLSTMRLQEDYRLLDHLTTWTVWRQHRWFRSPLAGSFSGDVDRREGALAMEHQGRWPLWWQAGWLNQHDRSGAATGFSTLSGALKTAHRVQGRGLFQMSLSARQRQGHDNPAAPLTGPQDAKHMRLAALLGGPLGQRGVYRFSLTHQGAKLEDTAGKNTATQAAGVLTFSPGRHWQARVALSQKWSDQDITRNAWARRQGQAAVSAVWRPGPRATVRLGLHHRRGTQARQTPADFALGRTASQTGSATARTANLGLVWRLGKNSEYRGVGDWSRWRDLPRTRLVAGAGPERPSPFAEHQNRVRHQLNWTKNRHSAGVFFQQQHRRHGGRGLNTRENRWGLNGAFSLKRGWEMTADLFAENRRSQQDAANPMGLSAAALADFEKAFGVGKNRAGGVGVFFSGPLTGGWQGGYGLDVTFNRRVYHQQVHTLSLSRRLKNGGHWQVVWHTENLRLSAGGGTHQNALEVSLSKGF